MKKQILLALLVLILCVLSLSGCKKEEAPAPTQPVQQANFQQLLGFESYDEITRAKLAVGHMLGKMELNTDKQYIKQGNGSLKISVQGDYGNSTRNPYFKIDFLNTSCATCDFSKFKSVSFDVYNASDKELHIKANLNVGKDDGNIISTAKETFTLKAKSWTTCTYDLSKMAGFTLYDFTSVRYMTIEFAEHKASREEAPNVFYIDNLIGTYFAEGEKPQVVTYNFYEGIDFETAGKELLFTGQGKENDALFERVAYSAVGIQAPEKGGEYALRLSHETNYWPAFRINFGETMPAGTVISFQAYGRINGESLYNQHIFEFTGGGEATEQVDCDTWTNLSFTLKQDAAFVDLFWNYDRAYITSGKASGEVFIDNMIATKPVPPIEPEGDFWNGLDFEIPGHAGLFVGQKIEGAERRDATIEWVTYEGLEIPALAEGGEHALRLSHESNYWPTFRINFGEKLPAGTIITFQAYARITSGTSNLNKSIFEFSSGGDATLEFKCDGWTELQMVLPTDAEYLDLFWNYDRAQITSETASAEVYIDNMKAIPGEPPAMPEGDFMEGIDFETEGNELFFGGVGGANAWRDATFEVVTFDGDKALKMTCESSQWPTFRIHFGKTLPAGTTITFDAYTNDTSGIRNTVSSFHYLAAPDIDIVPEYFHGAWKTMTITLPVDCEYVDMMCNMDRWNEPGPANLEIYLDNFKANEPEPSVEPEGDIHEGLGFEIPGNKEYFTGVGKVETDATIQRVPYAELDIPALPGGGEYALKISHDSFYWPTFRMSFGKTLKAGTKITFMAYGTIQGETLYNHSIFETTINLGDKVITMEATQQFACDQWVQLTIVIPVDTTYGDLFWNIDRAGIISETASGAVYIDNVTAIDPVVTEGNFSEGVGFEKPGNIGLIESIGGDDAYRDAAAERVSYESLGITAPANGGSYALKLSHANNSWPVFRVNFGKTLKAGMIITFDVYGNYNYEAGAGVTKYMKLELSADSKNYATTADPNQIVWTVVETWKTGVTITLTADCDHLDFFYNVADGQHGDVASWMLLDNFKAMEAAEPEEPVGDFMEGIDFETEGNEHFFAGIGGESAWSDATLERIPYADAGVTAPANGGSYALKVSHTNNCWPTFRVNFGKTLKAGTVITFDVYGNYDYVAADGVYKYMKLELSADSKNYATSADPNQVVWTLVETWKTGVSITLTADCDHLDFFYNVADGQHGEVSSWLLLDNFKAVEASVPAEPVGDFMVGIDFETEGNEHFFGGVGGENAWRDATFEVVTFDGDKALKLTCVSSQWPTFRIHFGKTLPAGTVLIFDAYTNDISGIRNTVSSFHFVSSPDTDIVSEYRHGSWTTLSITLPADCEYVDLMCNMDRWNEPGPANLEVYLDNFKAVEAAEPEEPVGDFMEGIDFETEGNELFFGGANGAESDATSQRVSYESLGIAAPANGGSYALKVSHTNNCWPTFRVNFGKTLKAGTIITFDVYGNYDYVAAAGVNKYMKLELSADSKNVATGEDPNQVVWTLVETWKTGVSITLTADCDHLDFFYNVADGQHGNVASWLLLDNFKAVEADVPAEPVGDLMAGIGFETEGNENFFAGTGASQDATIERVSYANAGVSAPANGGSYALKVSHANNCWPTFRVNFGKTLKAGTVITFDVYGNYDYVAAAGVNKYMKLELAANSKNFATGEDPNHVVWTLVETWKTGVSITLTADCDHLDFFYNVADGQHGEVASWLLLDNFKAVEADVPEEPVGDLMAGLGFETEGNESFFAGTGASQDATIERVSYANAGVSAPANGGSYALKVSHANNCWPTFRVNFGKTLKAGTVITFDVYGNYDYVAAAGVYKYIKLELTGDSKNFATGADPNHVVWTLVETWQTGVTVTLTADCDHVDFFYNVADGQHGEVASWLLLDNFKAVEPVFISNGLTFDNSAEAELFTGVGGNDAWRDASIEIVSFEGNNALKLSCANSCWPTFRVNFGKTLKAGTVITFDVYGNYDYVAAAGVYKYMKLELSANSKNFATSEESNQVVWTLVETWYTGATITLTADSDHVDFFYNVADGQHGEVASWLLLDNFKAFDPKAPAGDAMTDIDFESEGSELFFTGVGNAERDATIERVRHESIGIAAPANGGEYALKLSHAANYWPTFRIRFDETLAAGTKITFQAYGKITSGTYLYNQSIFEFMAGGEATQQFSHDGWKTLTITLTEDADHLDLFWNYDRAYITSSTASGEVYIDNMVITR